MHRMLGTADLGLLEALFEAHADAPFFVKDSRLRYVAANPAMARLCGKIRPQDLYGKTAGDIFPPKLAAHYEALDVQLLTHGRGMTSRLDRSAGPAGNAVWLLFSRLPVHDEQGQIVGVVANSRRMDGSVHDERYARLAVAIHHISEHYDWPLSLPDLARLAGISASQLDRDFVRLLGMSPRDFLHKVRIDEACHLLRGGAGVSEVAYACGYSDHSAFSRRFRLETGTSPRAWRRGLAVAGAATADEA